MVESFEISGYALAAAIGLGAAFTVTSKSNIRVDIALDLLPRRARRIADLLAATALAVTALALAWFCFGTLSQSWDMGARSPSTLATPLSIPQGIWWAGLAWFAAVAIAWPVLATARLLRGDTAGFDAAIGSLRVEDEIEQAGVAPPDPRP